MKSQSDVESLFDLLGVKNPGYQSFDSELDVVPVVLEEKQEKESPPSVISFSISPSPSFDLSNNKSSGCSIEQPSQLDQLFERLAAKPIQTMNAESPLVKMMRRLSS